MGSADVKAAAPRSGHPHGNDPLWVRLTLTSIALLVLTVLVVIPVTNVFYEALADGFGAYWRNLTARREPEAR